MKYAILDIGSNSVRLMLWADGKTLYKKLETTRLGAGLGANGKLSEGAMRATVRAVSTFCAEGRSTGAEVYAFATAAVRSASNGTALCKAILEECGLSVDVVSGKEEAELGIAGALSAANGGIIDIGGASCEIDLKEKGKTSFSVSLNVGAVRLLDRCHDDIRLLDEVLKDALGEIDGARPRGTVYAIGGTASTLACICRKREYDASLSGTVLTRRFVHDTANKLLRMSVSEREQVKGMEKKRADIIAGGAYLLDSVMEKLALESVVFSDADNLEGYLKTKVLTGKANNERKN